MHFKGKVGPVLKPMPKLVMFFFLTSAPVLSEELKYSSGWARLRLGVILP